MTSLYRPSQCRKIVCILKNYTDHAKEMQGSVPKCPEYFLKPTTSFLLHNNAPMSSIEIPKRCDVHHEVELGVVIGQSGRDISKEMAMDHVKGYVLALDMTARNVQTDSKKAGKPWSRAKGFDTFCPVSDRFFDKEIIPDPYNVELWLQVNGVDRQRGSTADMVFKIPDLICEISQCMTLEENDLILTGTPSGVGSIKAGDVITAGIGDLYRMTFHVNDRH